MTFSAAEGEVGVGCFLLRHLDLREPSLTQFTEDRERENEGGVDEKKNAMRDTGRKRGLKIGKTVVIISHKHYFYTIKPQTHTVS